MYGIGKKSMFSPKELRDFAKTDKLVKSTQKEIEKNIEKIKAGKSYESTQQKYDELMKKVDERVALNEQRSELLSAVNSEKKIEKDIEIDDDLTKLYYRILSKTSEIKMAEELELEVKLRKVPKSVIDKILKSDASDIDKGYAVCAAAFTYYLIRTTLKYMTNVEFEFPKVGKTKYKEFINAYVKLVFGEKFEKPFPENEYANLESYDVDNEKFDIHSTLIFSSNESAVVDLVINAAIQTDIDRKNGVVAVVNNAKLLPAYQQSDEEKLNEVVKELDLGDLNSPVTNEEPVDLFSGVVANSSSNIKFVHKYIKDLLGEQVANSCRFYEDPNNKFINVVLNNQIFLIDPANIYGFGNWSIMAFSANMININGMLYNDTVLVPLAEKEIVKKILTTPYIVSLQECDMIRAKYCFDNMAIYKFVDLSYTNNNKYIGTFPDTKAIKELGKILDKMLPLTQGFRFRLANVESATKFSLVSDNFVLSPLASNGETALPSQKPIEITSDSVLKKAA